MESSFSAVSSIGRRLEVSEGGDASKLSGLKSKLERLEGLLRGHNV
jgi:hypothetical protein